MRKAALILIAGIVVVGGLVGAGLTSAAEDEGRLLRHIVLIQFKADTTEEQIAESVELFKGLKKIEEVVDLEFGTNVSKEDRSGGLTHGFLLTFKSEEDLQTYIDHDLHKAFVVRVIPRVEKVVVFDYWNK